MYEDKLDGRIANGYFDSEAAEMRAAQAAIMRELEAHQTANRSYIEEGFNYWNWRTVRPPGSRVSCQRRNANS